MIGYISPQKMSSKIGECRSFVTDPIVKLIALLHALQLGQEAGGQKPWVGRKEMRGEETEIKLEGKEGK